MPDQEMGTLIWSSVTVTATLINLLPYAGGSPESVSEGIPLVSVKDKGEFVELLPELWSSTKGEDDSGKGWKNRKVTTWLQCFCAYVSIRHHT